MPFLFSDDLEPLVGHVMQIVAIYTWIVGIVSWAVMEFGRLVVDERNATVDGNPWR